MRSLRAYTSSHLPFTVEQIFRLGTCLFGQEPNGASSNAKTKALKRAA